MRMAKERLINQAVAKIQSNSDGTSESHKNRLDPRLNRFPDPPVHLGHVRARGTLVDALGPVAVGFAFAPLMVGLFGLIGRLGPVGAAGAVG